MHKDQFKGTDKESGEKTRETTPDLIDDKGLDYKDKVQHQTGTVPVRHGDATHDLAGSESATDQGYGRD